MSNKFTQSFLYLFFFLVLFASKSSFAAPVPVNAFEGEDGVFCNFYSLIKGPIGKTIAVLGVCMIGMMLLLGKASWGQMAIVFLFIALVFAAPQLVAIMTKGSELCSA